MYIAMKAIQNVNYKKDKVLNWSLYLNITCFGPYRQITKTSIHGNVKGVIQLKNNDTTHTRISRTNKTEIYNDYIMYSLLWSFSSAEKVSSKSTSYNWVTK